MNHKEYNGYYNYETWAFSLHANNDEYLNDRFNECQTEEDLKSLFDEMIGFEVDPLMEKNLFLMDVIQSFKSEINFRELIQLIESDRENERKYYETEENEEDYEKPLIDRISGK